MLGSGTVLQGRYRIERVLSQGDRSTVYRAVDATQGQVVVVKEIHVFLEDAEKRQQAVTQFLGHVRRLALLQHPGLVAVLDGFEEAGRHYLVMEWVDGPSLESVVTGQGTLLPVPTSLALVDEVAAALEYMHQQQPPLLFRYLHPGNILLGTGNHCRLVDFGLASEVDPGLKVTVIKGSGAVGFLALEARGKAVGVDVRTDVYALGATLYYLLTRAVPPSAIDLASQVETLQPPGRINAAVSAPLDTVVLGMMALRRDDRYPTVGAVRQALRQAWAQSPPAAVVPPRFCSECGGPNTAGQSVCGRCGRPLEMLRRESLPAQSVRETADSSPTPLLAAPRTVVPAPSPAPLEVDTDWVPPPMTAPATRPAAIPSNLDKATEWVPPPMLSPSTGKPSPLGRDAALPPPMLSPSTGKPSPLGRDAALPPPMLSPSTGKPSPLGRDAALPPPMLSPSTGKPAPPERADAALPPLMAAPRTALPPMEAPSTRLDVPSEPEPAASALRPGQVLERYVIDRLVGGSVYEAYMSNLKTRRVAIKEMRVEAEDGEQALARFTQQANFLAGLEHPNLVRVTDFLTGPGVAYLVTDYVDGPPLDLFVRARDGFLPLAQARHVALQLCDVLDYLHQQTPPIVLRDLNPGNILITSQGRCKLVKFGVAHTVESRTSNMTTSFLRGTGTHGYAAVEQYVKGSRADVTTDLYSLGAILYTLLTREVPPASIELATGQARLVAAEAINPDVPPALALLVAKMMSTQKTERGQTAQEVRTRLERAFDPAATPAPPSPVVPPVSAPPPVVPPAEARREDALGSPPSSQGGRGSDQAEAAAQKEEEERRPRTCDKCGADARTGLEVCPACGALLPRRKGVSLSGDMTPRRKVEKPKPVVAAPVVAAAAAEAPRPRVIPKEFRTRPVEVMALVSEPRGLFAGKSQREESVKVLELSPERMVFEAATAFKVPSGVQVQMDLPVLVAGDVILVDMKATLTEGAPLEGGRWRYAAALKEVPQRMRPLLAGALDQERRTMRRFKAFVQVLSKDLASYKAMAVDLSVSGVGIMAYSELAVGAQVEFQLDLDDTPRANEFSEPHRSVARASIVHCRPEIDGRFRIGARFETLPEGSAQSLYRWLSGCK